MHPVKRLLAYLACLLGVVGSDAPAHADGPVYAIVVGYNGAIPGAQSLEFADDDALKWAEILRLFADDVSLLTEIDDETASRWGFRDHGLSVALPPTRSQLRAAFARYNKPGARIIYVHVAHGLSDTDERGGEGFVKMAPDPLADPRGRLYRSDLRREVVDLLDPGARLDLVIDACSAETLVRRGEGTAKRVDAALAKDDLSARPNVGVILASRSGWQINESKELEGSYFSLVMRSALLGAGDPDESGVVRYSNLVAALRVAGRTKNRPREKFEPWLSPPGGKWGVEFVNWRSVNRPKAALRFGPEVSGHIQVYDGGHGLWASFGKARGHVVELRGVVGRTYHAYPKLSEAGRVWRATAARVDYDELSQPTPFVAAARGTEDTPIYEGLLHCKTFEGYALALEWPSPRCEEPAATPATANDVRLSLGYGVADAPFSRLAISHELVVAGTLPVTSWARLVTQGRIELASEEGATPHETIWGFGLGLGVEAVAFRWPRVEAGLSMVLGWAPTFEIEAGGSSADRWSDGFTELGFFGRAWFSNVAAVVALGLSLDLRPADEGLGVDPRWFARLGVEVGL